MNEGKTVFKNSIINILVVAACILSAVLLFVDNHPIFFSAAILPIAFLGIYILSLIFFPQAVYRNIGYLLYFGQSFVKCVAAPMALCLGNYTSLFGNLESGFVFRAVLLMIYEHAICTAVIGMTAKKEKGIIERKRKLKTPIIKPKTFLICFSLAIVFMWFLIPGVQDNFVSIFDMLFSNEMFFGNDYTSSNAAGTTVRIFTTLFLVLFKSFRIILPFYVIKRLKDKYGNVNSFFASLAVIALQFIFIPETVASSFIVAFMLLLYMMQLYPKYRRATVLFISASFIFIVFVLALSFKNMSEWHGVTTIMGYISQVLQSYVPGVCNTASIFRVAEVNKFSVLIDTLVSTVPFQSTVFGSAYWTHDLNTLFTSTEGLKSQIVSTVGGGWYLFGYLFAPIFSAAFTFISMVNGYKYEAEDGAFKKALYMFMCVQTMLGVGVYNIQTTITMWIQVGLALWFYSKLTSERTEEGKADET